MASSAMRIAWLIASSGVYHAAGSPGDDPNAPPRGSRQPGTFFHYNNWDFNAAGAIFERATGRDIYDALASDLAAPLGMQDFDRARQRKTGDASKSRFLAYHMLLSTRDMARLGVLMLRGGRWGGRAILPAGWAQRITRLVTPYDELIPQRRRSLGAGQRWGYGCMWWVWDAQSSDDPMAGAYGARGLFGQHITVIPKLDMVIAHKVDSPRPAPGERHQAGTLGARADGAGDVSGRQGARGPRTAQGADCRRQGLAQRRARPGGRFPGHRRFQGGHRPAGADGRQGAGGQRTAHYLRRRPAPGRAARPSPHGVRDHLEIAAEEPGRAQQRGLDLPAAEGSAGTAVRRGGPRGSCRQSPAR